MAEPIKIEVFKTKNPGDLTAALADPDSRLDFGGGAALSASVAAALLERAAARCDQSNERAAYILRNAEIVRKYMVHVIDEDVKSRAPLKRALREGGEREIEAARHPALAIPGEVVNMMGQTIDMALDLSALCPKEAMHYLGECVELALGAMKASRLYIIDMADQCSDDTFRYINRRENEITLKQYGETAAQVLAAVEAAI